MIRVISNFARLGLNFVLGLLIIRLLLEYDAVIYSIYVLVVVGIGIGAMLREFARIAIVPSLGDTIGGDPADFARAYASSFVVSAILAIAGLALMVALVPLLGFFAVPPEIRSDAAWFVVLRGAQAAIGVALAPVLNIVFIQRRFVLANGLLVFERLVDAAAVAALVWGIPVLGDGLTRIGLVGLLGLLLVYGIVALLVIRSDPRFMPQWSAMRRVEVRRLFGFFGWTAALVVAMNLFFRFDIVLTNLMFGAAATAALGIAIQAASMIQQLANGLVIGIDAEAAHLAQNPEGNAGMLRLLGRTLQLQLSIAGAASAVLFVATPQFLQLWLGPEGLAKLDVPLLVAVIRVLLIGLVVRCLAEGWMRALSGIGRLDSYVKWLLLAGVLNPPAILLALWLTDFEPLLVLAAIFAALHVLAYGIAVPAVAARVLGTSLLALYRPALLPAIAVVLGGVVYAVLVDGLETMPTLLFLLATAALFAPALLLATWSLMKHRFAR